MFNLLRSSLLAFLRVPPEPEPPFGDPASTKIFRASPKFYSFRLLGWGLRQLFLLGGLIVGVGLMLAVEYEAAQLRARPKTDPAPQLQADGKTTPAPHPHRELKDELATLLAKVPPKLFILIWVLKVFGLLAYLTQLAASYVALRLDYEMRWYIVTDRSLRIRTGLWAVQELTMSFANLQQVILSQGPIQRLLGIADVRVQSAGGGGVSQPGHQVPGGSLHTGFFHGVDNPAEVRDLILARLRHFRETGLGDPDEVHHAAPTTIVPMTTTPGPDPNTDSVLAARELLAETRHLRRALVNPA